MKSNPKNELDEEVERALKRLPPKRVAFYRKSSKTLAWATVPFFLLVVGATYFAVLALVVQLPDWIVDSVGVLLAMAGAGLGIALFVGLHSKCEDLLRKRLVKEYRQSIASKRLHDSPSSPSGAPTSF